MDKKKGFLLLFILFPFILMGQTKSPAFNAFMAQFVDLNNKYQEEYKNKLYSETESISIQMLGLIDNIKLSEQEKEEFHDNLIKFKSNVYYNMACAYSLKGDVNKAISILDSAIHYGYKDYRHILNDTDLDNIRTEKSFIDLHESIKQFDNLYVLQKSRPYMRANSSSRPQFTYQTHDASNLKSVRTYFKLDSVAGNGDELSKIMNLMKYVHNTIRHDGGNYALCEFDAIDIYNYHKATGMGVNCRHLAIALNEMYLSMGIYSRYITCIPRDTTDTDCHVINSVYSSQLKKWIWIDPTFNAYVKDDKGNLLSIAEVREKLIKSEPIVLNEDANWNNQIKQTKEEYLYNYMAKNLYWFSCPDFSRFNPESRYRNNKSKYINLVPPEFEKQLTSNEYFTHDAHYFWQLPSGKK